jgi:integrase
MPRTKLTEKSIARLQGRPKSDKSNEPRIYFDESLPGFGVSVSTKTGLKSYVVQRDLPNGRTRRITLGLVGEIKSLEEARALARDAIHSMRHGVDPKAARRGAPTLERAMEAYLSAHTNLAPKSVAGYRRALGYLADWKNDRLPDLTADMVSARHKKLGEQYGAATANSTMRSLRAWFNHAVDIYPEVTLNPVKLKKQWFNVARRERHVSADQLPKFYAAVMKLENKVARDYLVLLLFTGLRREEAASLTWQDIDLTAKVIRLPATRTKASRKLDLPMSDVVYDLLRKRRALGDDAHFVFPAHGKRGYISEPAHPLGLIAAATGIAISAHDLRRTFAKAAIAAGIHTMELKALLNHAVGQDVTSGYVILSENDLRAPAQRVADVLKRWAKSRRPH